MDDIPQAIEAECAVLGAIIRQPEALPLVGDLAARDFYRSDHARLFGAMRQLELAGDPLDAVSLEQAGGGSVSWIADLAGVVGTAENVGYYVQLVQESASRRRLLQVSDAISRAARGPLAPSETIARGIGALQDCYRGKSEFTHIREFAEAWYASAKERAENPDEAKPLGVPTGISRLNEVLAFSGLARGHLTVVGAESSRGKSALLDSGFVFPAARAGQKICLCSFEDSGRSVFVRGLSQATGIQNRQLQQELVEHGDWLDVHAATQRLAELDIWILDVVPTGVDSMVAQIRKHLAEHPADLLGIDYLQFIGAGVKTEGKTAASEYVITAIARLARELTETATVLLSQYRKLKDNAMPTDDDLRDANAVRYFAHTIIHIYASQKTEGLGCRTLIVSKNKNGPVGAVYAGWKPKTVTFCDPDEADLRLYLTAIGVKE